MIIITIIINVYIVIIIQMINKYISFVIILVMTLEHYISTKNIINMPIINSLFIFRLWNS